MFQTSRTSTNSQHPIFNPPGSHLKGNICEDPKPSFIRNCSSIQVFQDPQVLPKTAGALFVHSPYGEIHQMTREMGTPNFPSLEIDGATTPPLCHPNFATRPDTTTQQAPTHPHQGMSGPSRAAMVVNHYCDPEIYDARNDFMCIKPQASPGVPCVSRPGVVRKESDLSLHAPVPTIAEKSEHSQCIPGVLPQKSASNMTSRPSLFDLTTVHDLSSSMLPYPSLSRSSTSITRPQRPYRPIQEPKSPLAQTAGTHMSENTPHQVSNSKPTSFSHFSHRSVDPQFMGTASFSGPRSHFMETASFSGPTPKIMEAISFSDGTPSFSPPISFEGENSLHLPENSGECQTLISAMLTPKRGISDTCNPQKPIYLPHMAVEKMSLTKAFRPPYFPKLGTCPPPLSM